MLQNSTDLAYRAIYTREQLEKYFDTIKLPEKYRSSSIITSQTHNTTDSGISSLTLLTKLIRYQLANIPWENLELHYSFHHTISIDPDHIFQKMIERKAGRGGYCLENTLLMATVLRSLGYDVMTTGARVSSAVSQSPSQTAPKFSFWNHMALIVTVSGQKYLVDVGFSRFSPTFPVPLVNEQTSLNVHPSLHCQLTHQHILDNTHKSAPEQLLWVYSVRDSDSEPWIPGYCFSETEFLPADFEMMNFYVSQNRKSWFTYHIIAVKFIMDDETEEIVGDIILSGKEIKQRKDGKRVDLLEEEGRKMVSEADRVDALERFLGIKLSKEEKEGIKGMVSIIA